MKEFSRLGAQLTQDDAERRKDGRPQPQYFGRLNTAMAKTIESKSLQPPED